MSETQNEYETDAEPTPGPWCVTSQNLYAVRLEEDTDTIVCMMVSGSNGVGDGGEMEKNAELIASAGTAAEWVRGTRFDPIAAIDAVPKMLKALRFLKGSSAPMTSQQEEIWPLIGEALEAAKGNNPDAPNSAEGSDSE